MKFLYNVIDILFEYTAICLANFSMRIVNYNVYLAMILSILLGQIFVVDIYIFLLEGYESITTYY